MTKIMHIIFLATWKIQRAIIQYNVYLHSPKGNKIYRIMVLFWLSITFTFLFIYNNKLSIQPTPTSILIVEDIISLMLFFILCAYDFFKMLTSLSRFILYGFILSIILFLLIRNISIEYIPESFDQLIIGGCFCLVWCGLSIIANSTVSITANSIISGFLAIIILIINTIITMIPTEYPPLPNYSTFVFGIRATYTFQQKCQIDFNLSTVPILLITGTAAILAAVKSYWVKKYNGGQEITWKDNLENSQEEK